MNQIQGINSQALLKKKNLLTKLRRCVTRIHLAKIHLKKTLETYTLEKYTLEKYTLEKYTLDIFTHFQPVSIIYNHFHPLFCSVLVWFFHIKHLAFGDCHHRQAVRRALW